MFTLRFCLSVWRERRNLNSALTTSDTLKVRFGKYKQITVFGWLWNNVTVKWHLCHVYSAKFWTLHARFTAMQTIFFSYELPVRQHGWHKDLNICIRICLLTNFFHYIDRARRWPHWIKLRRISVTSDSVGFASKFHVKIILSSQVIPYMTSDLVWTRPPANHKPRYTILVN